MSERREYEMTEEEFRCLLEASKPVMMIALQCGTPPSPQANANAAWRALGETMGFRHMTVQPVPGKSSRIFSAEPKEESCPKTS